ncbi:MAG: hypothetical protein ABS81_13565 [Pseudonocardia sp. SCN 72-86]|nr:MAG: hypothetical protein ABS81_13565 [Pseudonocardia sp. SCN 72-86]
MREDAYSLALRLRHALGPRLHATTVAGLDDVLRTATTTPVREEERPADAALHHLAAGASRRRARRWRCARSAHRPARRRVPGRLAAGCGTLPLGLLPVRVHEIAAVRAEIGVRAGLAVLQLVGERLRSRLTGPDRAVGLGSGDFLLLLPTRGGGELDHLYEAVAHDLGAARERYPFVPLRAVEASRMPEPARIGA